MCIKKLIGETSEYEKKEMLEIKKPKSWLKSVSAFANGIGGTLIFGISDSDTIIGLSDAKRDAEIISEQIKTKLDPIPEVNLRFHATEDGKELIILQVAQGKETPYYYIGDGNRQTFIRIGNESVPADRSSMKRLVLKGCGSSFDSMLSQYKFQNMSFSKVRSVYKQRTSIDFEDSDYASWGIIDEHGELTNAGALLADESPIKHSRIFCTRWNGLDKAPGLMEAIDDNELTGGLVNLLQQATDFVNKNSRKAWMKTSDGRIEMPDYPERATLETIVNALIHRDYLEYGSEVHIDMFDDRMEIYSPGGMPDGTKVQEIDLLTIPSKRRNPIIADIFKRLKYMDRRGSGFKKIIEDYKTYESFSNGLVPQFKSETNSFFITLWNLNYPATKDVTKDVTKEQKQVILLIKENPIITTNQIANQLNLSQRQILRHIKELTTLGIIKREGGRKTGFWVIK